MKNENTIKPTVDKMIKTNLKIKKLPTKAILSKVPNIRLSSHLVKYVISDPYTIIKIDLRRKTLSGHHRLPLEYQELIIKHAQKLFDEDIKC